MPFSSSAVRAFLPTALFVLLWSSGALFARWGLDHASAIVFLCLRFALALAVLVPLAAARRMLLPPRGKRWRTAWVGLAMIGTYAVFYLFALQEGLTPGVLATVLGLQPILTLLATERDFAWKRLAGLGVALGGLVLVVFDSIVLARFSVAGVGCALAALACITLGAIGQKALQEPPLRVLPLQNAASLALCLLLLPTQPMRLEPAWGLVGALVAMGIVISVAATLLLYHLMQRGSLVNVTSLFYLVPGGTAVLDYVVFGNAMAPLALAGLAAIVAGLALGLRR